MLVFSLWNVLWSTLCFCTEKKILFDGQTALMQACQHGHWEVVQTLILSKANVSDCFFNYNANKQ